MKIQIFIAILCAALLTSSCAKKSLVSDLPLAPGSRNTDVPTAKKRGVCFNTNTTNWVKNIDTLHANWYYTWGTTYPSGAPNNVEFVPMFWGHGNVTQANIDAVNQMYKDGKIFYVLGFNEPDLSQESNMTVAQALDDWETLCKGLNPKIKLISPSVCWPGAAWFDQFMQGAASRNLRVDYISLHIYMGQSPTTYINQVNNIYNKYGKKVWITEFAPRDDNAVNGHPETNHYSADWILANFMPSVLTSFESSEAVMRYSWFSGSATMAGLWTSRLVNDDNSRTVLGDYYKGVGQ